MPDNTLHFGDDALTCPTAAYQSATVCVLVTVTPFAHTGTTSAKCCGTPIVTPGKYTCGGTKNGTCIFTISQDICVTVPVDFGATAVPGDTYVTCNGATSEDICADCDSASVII